MTKKPLDIIVKDFFISIFNNLQIKRLYTNSYFTLIKVYTNKKLQYRKHHYR